MSVNSAGCIQLNYENVIQGRSESEIANFLAPFEVWSFEIFFKEVTRQTHELTINQDPDALLCYTNCTILIVNCSEIGCNSVLFCLISDVPKQLARELGQTFPLMEDFDGDEIKFYINCCNPSCEDEGMQLVTFVDPTH